MINTTPKSIKDTSSLVCCMPLRINVQAPRSNDWQLTTCSVCGRECWKSELVRRAIKKGAEVACTTCALKAGFNNN